MSLLSPEILLLFALLGAFSGFAAGFLGIGGGVILVPLFLWAFKVAQFPGEQIVHMAFGTSLAIIFPTAVSSVLAHRKRGNVDWHQVFPLAIGGILGALAGSWGASQLPGDALRLLFGLLQIGIGLKMLRSRVMHADRGLSPSSLRLGTIGLVGGLFSSFFGIGGGVVAVPAMILFGGIAVHRAVGNSSALIVFSSFFGALGYVLFGFGQTGLPAFSFGYVHLLVFSLVAPLTILFARLGAKAASTMSNRRLLQAFACLLIFIGGRMLLNTLW